MTPNVPSVKSNGWEAIINGAEYDDNDNDIYYQKYTSIELKSVNIYNIIQVETIKYHSTELVKTVTKKHLTVRM